LEEQWVEVDPRYILLTFVAPSPFDDVTNVRK